jgi:hypothetical protein
MRGAKGDCYTERCPLRGVLDEYRKQVEVNQRVIEILVDEVKRLAKLATEENR